MNGCNGSALILTSYIHDPLPDAVGACVQLIDCLSSFLCRSHLGPPQAFGADSCTMPRGYDSTLEIGDLSFSRDLFVPAGAEGQKSKSPYWKGFFHKMLCISHAPCYSCYTFTSKRRKREEVLNGSHILCSNARTSCCWQNFTSIPSKMIKSHFFISSLVVCTF